MFYNLHFDNSDNYTSELEKGGNRQNHITCHRNHNSVSCCSCTHKNFSATTSRPKMTGWRHGNRCTGLSCSWLFNNSKGQDTGEKNPKPAPLFLMSFVWQEASQPRQRISAQECLMSKSTQKKGGEVGGNPTPGLLSLWPSSNGFERASRGSAAQRQAEGRREGRRHPLFIPLPDSVRAVDVHASPRMRPGSGS